ncbi:MAG: alpha/beta hydrolase [Flavobacteriales bacterium]
MSRKRIILLIIVTIIALFFLGPQPEAPSFKFELPSNFPSELAHVDDFIEESNSIHNIKPDNESVLIWADSPASKTEYALVYLHGFSASPGEGNPVNRDIAEDYGMNIYIPRLAHHGLNSNEPLLEFSGVDFINSTYEAIKLAELLGEKVIVMSCSTGGTASLYSIAYSDVNVHSQIMYSPNISLSDPKASLLTMPWGLQIARLVKGSHYNIWELPDDAVKYWYGKYRLEAVVELQNMLETSMTPTTFSKISVPTFISYYYEDDENQDEVVSVEAIKGMINQLSVPKEFLIECAFTTVNAHALQSEYFSQDIPEVKKQTREFIENVLKIKKPETRRFQAN